MNPALADELERRLERSMSESATGRALYEAVHAQGTRTSMNGAGPRQSGCYIASTPADSTIHLNGEASLRAAQQREARVGDILAADYAHEAAHARQHAEGRLPDARALDRDSYVRATLANEAEAQAISCQVAAELAAQGYRGAVEQNNATGYRPMTKAFNAAVEKNPDAMTNGEGRQAAQAAWADCGFERRYRRKAASDWQDEQTLTLGNDHDERQSALRALDDRLAATDTRGLGPDASAPSHGRAR